MNTVFLTLRYLFCLLLAGGLLAAFSYPDAILPPNPVQEDAEGFSLYSLKPYLWLIPVLLMELVSGMGKGRNRVWFGALLTVLVLALAAYPVLQAHWPEFVKPTFSYQGGMLSTGIWYYIAFVAASLVIRLVFLAYAFPAEDYEEKCEVGYVSASVLDPGSARTVAEIAADKKARAHRFHFKEADSELALRFRLAMRRLVLRSMAANAAVAGGVVLLLLWVLLYPQPDAEESLQRDMRTMYEHRITPQGHPVATRAAVHAAARVMKYISDHESLAGMTRSEAEEWLRLDNASESYRAWLRDERDIELPSTNSMYETRTRFLTVTNGRQICVLYIRTNEAENRIVVSELQEAGWDASADELRRRMGNDWGALYK